MTLGPMPMQAAFAKAHLWDNDRPQLPNNEGFDIRIISVDFIRPAERPRPSRRS